MKITAKDSCHAAAKVVDFVHDLIYTGLSREGMFHLLNFYTHTWSQLRELILDFRFTEVAHVYCSAGTSGMPSEFVLFRSGGVILGIIKS